MSFLKPKKDRDGQEIYPGDVCIYAGRFVVFRKPSWGGPNSKGLYGRFISEDRELSLRYSSVRFAFDPLSPRRNRSENIQVITKKFYEG